MIPFLIGGAIALITRKDKEVKIQTGLGAPQHSGLAKEALDDCGRLKPGYKYNKQGVLEKVEQKVVNKIENLLKKFPIVMEWTEGANIENKGYKYLEDLEKELKSFGFTDNPEETYIKNKVWFKNYKHYIRIDISISKGDFNPEKESLYTYLKREYKDFNPEDYLKNPIKEEIKQPKLTKRTAKASNTKTVKKKDKTTKPINAKQSTNVKVLPLSKINTDVKRFQNRKQLNKAIVNNIVSNFNETNLDPLIIWLDPADNKYYLLAGHHRFAALKKLNKKEAPVKIANQDYPKEVDAIRYAKEESNANRSLEKPFERAEIYRRYRQKGKDKKFIETKAEIEGKNKSYILNLSYLNPKGKTLQALIQFDDSTSVADTRQIEKIADWIGQARKNNSKITDAYENEMFDFLTDKQASKRITTKVEFLQKINSVLSAMFFDPTKPLNLKRFKYETEGEKQYNNEVAEIQDKIKQQQENIDNIKERFYNPGHKDYVNPNHTDYFNIKKVADKKIQEYNQAINKLQKEIALLFKNKSKYVNAGSNQAALFGANLGKPKVFNIADSLDITIIEAAPTNQTKDQPAAKVFEVTKAAEPSKPKNTKGVVSSNDLMAMQFDSLNFTGDWANFMQEPAKNMRIAVWGKPKNGKTAGATKLANYLTDFGNVLYNFADQGFNKSTKDLWKLSGLSEKPNAFAVATRELDELEKLCESGKYNFVFIDMINTYIHRTGIKYFEFEDRFLKKFPDISFILIFEVTKSGDFKGDQGWTHLVDAIVTVDSFVMENQGRYGVGHYVIWKEGLLKTNPKKYNEFIDESKDLENMPSEIILDI